MPTPRAGYFLADGTKVPGTTTVLSRWKDSGGLLQWAFGVGRSGAPTLYAERDKAGDIGTLAHAMAEQRMRGGDPESALAGAPEELKGKARNAYRMFAQWLENLRAEIQVVSAETPLVSEAMRVGGTPDFVIRMPNGRLAMGDIKTSNGIYRDNVIQVAAYAAIWNENFPDDPITEGFHIARFAKEHPDFEHRFFAEADNALELFKLLRIAYDLDIQLKKRVG
jgi:hypothetical protein